MNESELRKRTIWMGLVEVRPLAGCELLGRSPGAFTNIITWASDAVEYREQVETLARAYNLHVADVQHSRPIVPDDMATLAEELETLVRQAEENSSAILFGTFHKYRFDEA